jgi:hypothetical protein
VMTAGGGRVRWAPRQAASSDSFAARLAEIGMFFDGRDAVHDTMRRVAAALDRESIAYAIVGGMAVTPTGTPARRGTSTCCFPPTASSRSKDSSPAGNSRLSRAALVVRHTSND